ncbi:hypothetical protein [Caldisalinibacter kiritimatiensis]|uniref:Uncharacterized protein n=1 Tax=Caldisalinibacter kiritimatiensis TaxID=1304284 RepID=R1AQX0_9FIRM|nr:hypothetical protein [Caldisalinibacter kiritimatiensis]EOC99517.1 hypothetical protein L21TH_2429 [Caldisalinibacter kiritimatiensis]
MLNYVDLNYTIEKVIKFIESEINSYFVDLEKNINNWLENKANIYDIRKEQLISKIVYENQFEAFLEELKRKVRQAIAINIDNFYFDIDINKIVDIKWNKSLQRSYYHTHFLSGQAEKNIDKLLDKFFYDRISNKVLKYLTSKGSLGEQIFYCTGISSKQINERHKEQINKRIIGIITNIRYRLIREVEKQIYENINNVKEKTA